MYTLPRGVGVGCLRGLMEWVEWMYRIALSVPTIGTSPGVRSGKAVYSPNRDGYEVEWCGQGGGGIQVWLHARVLCGCEAECEVLADHGAGSGEHKQNEYIKKNSPSLLAFFDLFCLHTASAPITAGTHTGGDAVTGKRPARRHSRNSCHMFVFYKICDHNGALSPP